MMTRRLHSSFVLASLTTVLVLGSLMVAPGAPAADAPVIPLPPDVAKELQALGKGVVGKALPAPELTDVRSYFNIGPGTWEYQILEGGKEGKKVRTESYSKAPDKDGADVWMRNVGTEFVEYLSHSGDEIWEKHLEDDLDLGYTSRFLPAVGFHGKPTPGATRTFKSKIEAFKTAKPDHVSYRGEMTAKMSYVGMYEVKTPAGTFPAVLIRSEFDIEIGPAKVTDTMYNFFAKGVGKVAEIEATRISALLIYHSNTEVAKVLKSYPKH